MFPDELDKNDLTCLSCGHVQYAESPIAWENDRRNRMDNRQIEEPFDEYEKALSPDDFARMKREIGI